MKKTWAILGGIALTAVGVWAFVEFLLPFGEKGTPPGGDPVPVGAKRKIIPPDDTKFPTVRVLRPGDETALALAIDEPMVKGKNMVYSPVALLAWNELITRFEGPIKAVPNSPELFLRLIRAKGYEGCLDSDDYKVEVSGDNSDGWISIASFDKSLPFAIKLDKGKNAIVWAGEPLHSFSLSHFDEDMMKQFRILYYKNDDQFIISLQPNDPEYFFILAKGFSDQARLEGCIASIYKSISQGEIELKSGRSGWKYTFDEDDSFLAPALAFHLEFDFPEMRDFTFHAGEVPHLFRESRMRIGFVLDENGGKIYAESIVMTDSIGAEPPRPQHFIFDKPFIVIAKKKAATHPALVVSIQNTALLRKQKE